MEKKIENMQELILELNRFKELVLHSRDYGWQIIYAGVEHALEVVEKYKDCDLDENQDLIISEIRKQKEINYKNITIELINEGLEIVCIIIIQRKIMDKNEARKWFEIWRDYRKSDVSQMIGSKQNR